MSKISAIVIVKNGEELIADCLDSLSFCDETIVIDDSSTDRTSEIAKRMGAKIFETGNSLLSRSFAEKRDYGLKKVRNKWVVYVDVDERVTPELAEEIKAIVKNDQRRKVNDRIQIVAYRLKRKNFYFGNHEWPSIEKLERLFDKNYLKGWHGDLHETAMVEGTIGELEGFLLHYTHRNLISMVNKTIEWSKIEADLRFKSKHPKMTWWRFPRVMLTAFWGSYVKQRGYKAGTPGLVESIYQAFSMFITYARLWELQERKNKGS